MSDSAFGYLISAAAAVLLVVGFLNALTRAAEYHKTMDGRGPSAPAGALQTPSARVPAF